MDSSDEFSYPNNQNQNVKKYIMALMFIQTKELKKIYEGKEIVQKKCYLIDKNWMNNFKNNYNYEESITTFNSFNDWKDYDDFKSKIIKYFNIDNKDITTSK